MDGDSKSFRNAVIVVLVVIVAVLGWKWYGRSREQRKMDAVVEAGIEKSGNISGVEEKLQKNTNIVVPELGEKKEMIDVGNKGNVGIMRKFDGQVEVLADLAEGEYEIWIEKGGESKKVGMMRGAKGGYLWEADEAILGDFEKVVVAKSFTGAGMGERVLEVRIK